MRENDWRLKYHLADDNKDLPALIKGETFTADTTTAAAADTSCTFKPDLGAKVEGRPKRLALKKKRQGKETFHCCNVYFSLGFSVL